MNSAKMVNTDNVSDDDEFDQGSTESSSSDDDFEDGAIIMKDFIAATPSDSDIPGIAVLCLQMLKFTGVDSNELAKLLVEQNYVTTVMKAAPEDIPGEEDDDEQVYGVFGVVNLKTKKDNAAVKQFLKLVLEMARKSGKPEAVEAFTSVLSDSSRNASRPALLMKERIVNIPGIATPPFMHQLRNDMRESALKGMAYDFTHYIHVSKVVTLDEGGEYFVDQEDEEINRKHVTFVDFTFEGENDVSLVFQDNEGKDVRGTPFRRFYLITEEQLQDHVDVMTKVRAAKYVMEDAQSSGLKLTTTTDTTVQDPGFLERLSFLRRFYE